MSMPGETEGVRYVQASEPGDTTLTLDQLMRLLEERTTKVAAMEAAMRQQLQQGNPVITVPVQVVPDTQAGSGRTFKLFKPDSFEGARDPMLLEHWKHQMTVYMQLQHIPKEYEML